MFDVFIPLGTLKKESDVSVRNISPTFGPQLGIKLSRAVRFIVRLVIIALRGRP